MYGPIKPGRCVYWGVPTEGEYEVGSAVGGEGAELLAPAFW